MISRILSFFCLAISLAAGVTQANAQNTLPIEALTSGAPRSLGPFLGPKSFVEVEATELAHPTLIYLNAAWLRRKKFDLPRQPSVSFTGKVLKVLGWGVRRKNDPDEAFGPKTVMMVTDRYGGPGTGPNLGGARGAIAGMVQFKGIGPNSLTKQTQIDHGNGVMPFVEGPREAIWGGLNAAELPYGGNEIVAIIGRGTRSEHQWIGETDDVVVVRADALRPGNYVIAANSFSDEDLATGRVAESVRTLLKHLAETGPLSAGQNIRTELLAYTERIATQYGTLYARGIYHGAYSPSNQQWNGGTLDYGTMSAVPRHEKIQFLEHIEPNGEFGQIRNYLVDQFLDSLRQNAPPEYQRFIPSKREATRHFEHSLKTTFHREFLIRTGVPPEIVLQLENSSAASDLGKRLFALSNQGSTQQLVRGSAAIRTSQYDLAEILTHLAQSERLYDPHSVIQSLEQLGINTNTRSIQKFSREYAAFMTKAEKMANQDQVSKLAFEKYVHLSAELKNKELTDLYRWNLLEAEKEVLKQYAKDQDAGKVQHFIDDTIHKARRYYRSTGRYELVLDELEDPWSETTRRKIFIAKTGVLIDEIGARKRNCPGQILSAVIKH